MTAMWLVSAYVALTLGFWIHALRGMSIRARSRRRERLFGMEERVLIAIVAGLVGMACVAFLVRDDASFITGSTISANGGQYMVG